MHTWHDQFRTVVLSLYGLGCYLTFVLKELNYELCVINTRLGRRFVQWLRNNIAEIFVFLLFGYNSFKKSINRCSHSFYYFFLFLFIYTSMIPVRCTGMLVLLTKKIDARITEYNNCVNSWLFIIIRYEANFEVIYYFFKTVKVFWNFWDF